MKHSCSAREVLTKIMETSQIAEADAAQITIPLRLGNL